MDQLSEHWAGIPKVLGSVPTVVRHIFQFVGCGCSLRVTSQLDFFIWVLDGNAMDVKVLLLGLVLTAMFVTIWISVWAVTLAINGQIGE